MARTSKTKNADVARLIEHSDIVAVAEKLGLQLDARRSRPRRAVCPFHEDHDPSLHLYQSGSSRGHYHCFVCGAHGDVLSLIQKRERLDFWEALQRLAGFENTVLPSGRRSSVDRRSGANLLIEGLLRAAGDSGLLAFAERRGFAPDLFRHLGAATYDLRGLVDEARADRVLEEQLVRAGIIRRTEIDAATPELFSDGLRGFFFGHRLVFPLADLAGMPVGFAARALNEETPKYLFSYDFPRRDTLFGADRVLRTIQSGITQKALLELYLVEGIFDQIRLESLGLHSVAILGARISTGQIAAIQRLVQAAGEAGRNLSIHLFLDPDEAGQRGTYDAVIALLRLLDQTLPFALDVIVLLEKGRNKLDPDEFLRGKTREEANWLLAEACVSPLVFLAAYQLKRDPHALNWIDFTRLQQATTARHIATALPNVSWGRVLAPLGLSDPSLASLAQMVRSYADPDIGPEPVPSLGVRDATDDRASLLTALTMGRSSTTRREYPLDDDAWDRLAIAASPLFHIHRARLEQADGPSTPLLARHLPKGSGRYRLKAGPVAPDALLQQYALVELLRDRPDTPRFSSGIPAVRYEIDRQDGHAIYRTGAGGERMALSFAYQIDMAIVNGLAPPRREGIFRPYFECWRSFIDFLDQRIRHYRHEELQVLRLDVTGFYEHVRRDVVGDALQIPLEQSLHLLGAVEGGCASFAPLLAPHRVADPAIRAQVFTSFLIRHSYGLDHHDPETGAIAPVLGVPQGPDLSAYLANISLFSLDDIMEAEIDRLNDLGKVKGEQGNYCSAAYCRYVDDIVIVCTNLETAAQLRRKVESHLEIKGLALNHKNVTPPPMVRAEARAWLTDNRAGLGFSGPLAELPVTEAMDPLADAGEINRKTALGLLHDAELDDPSKSEKSLKQIALALQATEVRFSDRANGYRRLWRIATERAEDASGTAVAKSYCMLLAQVEPELRLMDAERVDLCLACIEGLDRALRAIIPPGALDDEVCVKVALTKLRLGQAVLNDLFSPLARFIFPDGGSDDFLRRYDVRCQIAIISCLAADHQGREAVTSLGRLRPLLEPQGSDGVRALPEELRMSLFRHDASYGTTILALPVPSPALAASVFDRLNRMLVNLQRVARFGDREEPAPYPRPTSGVPPGLDRVAGLILHIWSPGDVAHADEALDAVEFDAAATLVNLTYNVFGGIAARRARLLFLIVGTADAKALPSPPGLAASGILLWCADRRLLLARAGDNDIEPVGVVWRSTAEEPFPLLHLHQAELDSGCQPLGLRETTWNPSQIAAVYRSGLAAFDRQRGTNHDSVPVPTAFSFFSTLKDGVPDPDTLRLICWTAPRASVDGHAFVRRGASLEARAVHAEGADYWRFGWAVRDLCDRVDGPADGEDGLDRHAETRLDRDTHRREAILARVLPRLSGADRWGPGEVRPGALIPTRIERALKLLEGFGRSSSASTDAAYLVAALAEGLFMSERVSAAGDLGLPGRPAALLLRAARRASRALPEAAKHWCASGEILTPYRRSAAAWTMTASRIERQIEQVTESATLSLRAMVLGSELLGAVSDLRGLAFEIASALPLETVERLCSVELDLAWLTDLIGIEGVLLDDSTAIVDPSLSGQATDLMQVFDSIIAGRQSSTAAMRDRITPLGWAVLVATLLQITLPGSDTLGERPVLWTMRLDALVKSQAALRSLVRFFASGASPDGQAENWPWDLFGPLAIARPANISALLRTLTDAASLTIEDTASWSNPRTEESQNGRSVIRLADGSSLSLAGWQIDIAFVAGEKRAATEADEVGIRKKFRYSATRVGDQLLGMHLVSRRLAEVAFGREVRATISRETNSNSGVATKDVVSETTVAPQISSQRAADPEAPTRFESSGRDDGAQDDELAAELDEATNGEPVLADIRHRQAISWRKRGANKALGVQRVAIVQWDVEETYSSPGAADARHEGLWHEGLLCADATGAAQADNVRNGGKFLSTVEARRRALIKELLSACALFQVDGLVFPEYSLRPETVNWVAGQLRQRRLPLTVWCGTFRVPDGTKILSSTHPTTASAPYLQEVTGSSLGPNSWDAHSALLTCLNAVETAEGPTVHFHVRRKRYPSAAADELIRPPVDEAWRPLLADERNVFRLGAFTLELICSEIFPHASSANYLGVLAENRELAARYGLVWHNNSAMESLSKDVYEFARWTAYGNGGLDFNLTRGEALQRTLIILPAMTARSADYHVFGQNQYLAAGLVTAFCNAVTPPYGCGESGFIGLDGWKSRTAVPTPYGSVAPGIFQLGGKHSGPLGKTEAAMVIADLDLIRTADQRPRPHYQGRALRLVAHLPLIFATEPNNQSGQDAEPCGRRRLRRRMEQGVGKTFVEAGTAIQAALDVGQHVVSERAIASPTLADQIAHASAIDATLRALRVLERYADDPVWLEKRTKSFETERWTYVPSVPLPALVDWIYVDDRWNKSKHASRPEYPSAIDAPVLAVPRVPHARAATKPKSGVGGQATITNTDSQFPLSSTLDDPESQSS